MAKRIMVVDDEQDTRELVKTILEGEGFEVVMAENGDDCLEKVDSSISIILLDVMMPGKKPKEVIEEIEKNEELKDVKIIYFTVLDFTEEKKKLIKGQAVDYIQKPFEIEELVMKVKKQV